ncbi:NUDIX domain-containing protein, partial [bacterium]|nr:NUDIX domain-containing protein [bacterium]
MNPGKDIFQFCPHCGARDFHPASAKKNVCGACGFNYYFNPVGAAAAIILDALDRILLIRRAKEPAKGTYDLPGGFIDFHETIESGLRREIREEVGLEVDE